MRPSVSRCAEMALDERTFEELSIEEVSLWLKEKGFSTEVQEAFER